MMPEAQLCLIYTRLQVKAVLEQGALGPSSKLLANVDPSNNQSLSKALEDACR